MVVALRSRTLEPMTPVRRRAGQLKHRTAKLKYLDGSMTLNNREDQTPAT